MTQRRELHIEVPVLARVEGEGALELDIENGALTSVHLRIYEPPRFYEKLLEGRHYTEVADVVARICGICPVAYQMSAVYAMESAFGVNYPPALGQWVHAMRRVMYCGEWIESHSLHIHLLGAPDFLGADSVIELARSHPEAVRRGLRLQALGNDLIRLFGGRSVHPVGVCVGGFHRAPDAGAVATMIARLREALPEAEALVAWTASLPLPDDAQDFVSVALREADEPARNEAAAYPFNTGRLVSDQGLDIAAEDFATRFSEHQVPHSTALHALLDGQPYLVGPLARLNLNLDRLPEPVRAVLDATGVRFPSRNLFHSMVARAVEIHFAVYEALRLLEAVQRGELSPPASMSGVAHATVQARAGSGVGCTEAPRGLLWHRYEFDDQGLVRAARIVPPTSQNQARIEEDLRGALQRFGLEREEADLCRHGETVIRNYDPCISCASHFLRLKVRRR